MGPFATPRPSLVRPALARQARRTSHPRLSSRSSSRPRSRTRTASAIAPLARSRTTRRTRSAVSGACSSTDEPVGTPSSTRADAGSNRRPRRVGPTVRLVRRYTSHGPSSSICPTPRHGNHWKRTIDGGKTPTRPAATVAGPSHRGRGAAPTGTSAVTRNAASATAVAPVGAGRPLHVVLVADPRRLEVNPTLELVGEAVDLESLGVVVRIDVPATAAEL